MHSAKGHMLSLSSTHLPATNGARRRFYLQQVLVEEYLPGLASLGLPLRGGQQLRAAVGDENLVTCTLFCGAAGVSTALNFDRGDYALERGDALSSIHNLFLQLSGQKRFRLFCPCDHDRLYPRGPARLTDRGHRGCGALPVSALRGGLGPCIRVGAGARGCAISHQSVREGGQACP